LDLREAQEQQLSNENTCQAIFVVWDIEDCLENGRLVWATTWGAAGRKHASENSNHDSKDKDRTSVEVNTLGEEKDETDELDTVKMAEEYWAAMNSPPNIHIAMDPASKKEFIAGYAKDRGLEPVWNHCDSNPTNWVLGRRFFWTRAGRTL
jgi:hypothetical protein